MGFEMIDNVLNLELDLITTTTLAVLLFIFGNVIRKKIYFFEKFSFPAPVLGGFFFAILAWLLKTANLVEFSLDTTLQTPLMLVFFTTVGIAGSFALIKTGGRALIIYLLACWTLSIIQNSLGASIAYALGEEPVLGVLAGAVALEGGHGAAVTFGELVEKMGVEGGVIAATAAATFGLIAGSLTGGPLANWLIKKNNLEIETDTENFDKDFNKEQEEKAAKETITTDGLIKTMGLLGVLMILGGLLNVFVNAADIKNFALPSYVGAMIIAIIFRNINDKKEIVEINMKQIDMISDISLGIFLVMAMMSLEIWSLANLALPLIIILIAQVVVLLLLTAFVLFPLLGKDYDAAVMCSGMMGHGLGATPNGVANMDAICEKYGLISNKAFMIVPLCGAVLIDIVAIPCITIFIGFLVK